VQPPADGESHACPPFTAPDHDLEPGRLRQTGFASGSDASGCWRNRYLGGHARRKALLAALPAAYQTADLDNGQAKFALCQSCHTVAQGGTAMTGPNLWGVFGRKAGSAPGFTYSDGLKASGIVWDAASLDKWITNPRGDVAGTKMTYLGMESAKDRADTIAYLKTVTTAPAS
jgi:cytochrome c